MFLYYHYFESYTKIVWQHGNMYHIRTNTQGRSNTETRARPFLLTPQVLRDRANDSSTVPAMRGAGVARA